MSFVGRMRARKFCVSLGPLLFFVLCPSPLHSIAGSLRQAASQSPHGAHILPLIRLRLRGGGDREGFPPGVGGSKIKCEARPPGGKDQAATSSVLDAECRRMLTPDPSHHPHEPPLPLPLPGSADQHPGVHFGSHPLMAFNSLTKSKVPIVPFEDGKILMYSWVCPFRPVTLPHPAPPPTKPQPHLWAVYHPLIHQSIDPSIRPLPIHPNKHGSIHGFNPRICSHLSAQPRTANSTTHFLVCPFSSCRLLLLSL